MIAAMSHGSSEGLANKEGNAADHAGKDIPVVPVVLAAVPAAVHKAKTDAEKRDEAHDAGDEEHRHVGRAYLVGMQHLRRRGRRANSRHGDR